MLLCCPVSVVKTRVEVWQLLSCSSLLLPAPTRSQFVALTGPLSLFPSVAVLCCVVQGSGGLVYRSALHGLSSIVRSEGIQSLYAGVLPSLIKDCPYAAVYLLLYTRFKQRLANLSTARRSLSNDVAHSTTAPPHSSSSTSLQSEWHVAGQTPVTQFVSAFGAATVATVAFQPLEVIKTRLQLPSPLAAAASSTSSTTTTRTSSFSRFQSLTVSLYRTNGVSAFFAGLLPRVMRRSLSNAIAWSLFEQIYTFWSGKIAI